MSKGKRERKQSVEADYVEYIVRIPREADDVIMDVVISQNKKLPPAKHLSNEAYIQMIFRDWYISQIMPLKLRLAQAEELRRQTDVWLAVFKAK